MGVKSRFVISKENIKIEDDNAENINNNELNNPDEEEDQRIKRENEERMEKARKDLELKEKKEKEMKKNFKNPSNAFIPFLIERNKKVKRNLLLKISIIILLIGVLIYFITANLILVRNQGGNNKALFWI